MRFQASPTIGILYGVRLATAVGYADNQLPTIKDEPHIAANFPEPDIELFSPAFTNPEGIPRGFENGTASPTDQDTLGRLIRLQLLNQPSRRPNKGPEVLY